MTTSSHPDCAPVTDERAGEIQRDLLCWYRANKRDLPWRGADAYGIWISEIMLQQTQVATVIPYYLRFIIRFPTVAALAAGSLDDVLQLWAGLGYYARARNLHRAAGILMDRHNGHVPDTIDEILALPGIGSYTCGAILSIAYDRKLAAIDANVIRVLCRLFGIGGDSKSNAALREIRRSADRLVPASAPGEFNQALMELGALVCDPAEPNCEHCPLIRYCAAGNSPNPTALPEYPAAASVSHKVHSCVVISNASGDVLLVQRPAHGLWGGLWEFPRVVCAAGEEPADAAKRAASEIAGVEVQSITKLIVVKHAVTRYRITLHAFRATLVADSEPSYQAHRTDRHSRIDAVNQAVIPDCQRTWAPLDVLNEYAFSSPQSLVRKALLDNEGQIGEEGTGNNQRGGAKPPL